MQILSALQQILNVYGQNAANKFMLDMSMDKSVGALATNNMRFRPQICTIRTRDRRKNRRGRAELRIVH